MKHTLAISALLLTTLLLSAALYAAAIQRQLLRPPEGTLWLGPVAINGHRDCITQWNMPCAAKKPWTVRVIVQRPEGGLRMWKVLRIEPIR